jgi:hypothetical protein
LSDEARQNDWLFCLINNPIITNQTFSKLAVFLKKQFYLQMKKSKLRVAFAITDDAKTTRRCFGIDGKVGWGVALT